MKRHIRKRWLAVATIALAICSAPFARADWPLVRGDSEGTGVAHDKIVGELTVLWKYAAGHDAGFEATAVVASDTVYVGDNAGTFHAVYLADGSKAWTKEFADNSFIAGAAIENGRVYVGDMNNNIHCLAAADGNEIWGKTFDGQVYAAPGIAGDHVLFTSDAGTLSCRNKSDGEEKWAFHIEAPLRCTPTIANGRAALAGCDSRLHIVDVADGKEVGSVEIDAPTGATPAMRGGLVYFGTEGATFYAIKLDDSNGKKPAAAWMYHDPQRSQPIRAAAAVDQQIVVFGAQGKAIYGLDAATGEKKWLLPTRSRIESSPVIVGERVVVATTAGKIYLLDLKTGNVQWEYDAGGSFLASPAVADGKILLGNTDGTLYCFGATQTNPNKTTTKDTKSTK